MPLQITAPCMQCTQDPNLKTVDFARLELRDDGRYEFVCSHGHSSATILQHHRFEILFEIGAHAILDGYYREAVLSFAGSLERFYEFAIRVLIASHESPSKLFEHCWKHVTASSERQLGAFVFLWAARFDEAPDVLPDKMTKFRNQVIHKGKIPSREEAERFGNEVLDLIRPKMRSIRQRFHGEAEQIGFELNAQLRDGLSQCTSHHLATLLNMANACEVHNGLTLSQYVKVLANQKAAFDGFYAALEAQRPGLGEAGNVESFDV